MCVLRLPSQSYKAELEMIGQYGNVDEQIDLVAEQLAEVSELSGGFDAIGFSQGATERPWSSRF